MAGWAIVWQIVIWLVTTAIAASQMRVPKGGPASGADKFRFPTASEDRAVPVIFGPRWAKGPNVVWWGNLVSRAIKQSAGRKYAFFGPRRYTIINYIYSLGMHLILAHKADKIMAVKIGDKVLAEGLSITANGSIVVGKPELFGGEKAGGGFVGPIDFEFGLPAQPVNGYLDGQIAGPVSAHRGVVGMVMRDCEITAAPPGQEVQIQPVSVLLSATTSMCSWYPAKVTTPSGGMNPAHMLRVCATRQPWNNQQYTDADVDDASFTAAADILFAEDFGLAAEISDEAISADDAVSEIMRHIDGTLYEDRFTGKLSLTLNRGGYDIGSLLLLDDSCVSEVEEYTRLGWGERINQVTVSYYDLEADKNRSTTPIYDPAAEQAQGGVVARVQQYPWVFQGAIAAQLAERDLRQLTADLGVATIVVNRKGSSIKPGDVFRWASPKHGVTEIVMRARRVDYGALADGRVRIICAQDIFSLPAAVYSAPPPSGWQDPVNDPQAAGVRAVFEAPFWLTGPGAFDPATSGTILALAGKPTPDATDFEFWAGTPYAEVTDEPGSFSESATLTAAALAQNGPSTWSVSAGISAASVGQLAIIDSEIVRIDAVGASVTVSRGMLDTVPAAHSSGARLVVFEDNLAREPFTNGTAVNVKLLPATIRGRLALASAPVDVVTMNRRHLRPYPPGDAKVNSASYPTSIVGAMTASWAHRDRMQQLAEPLLTQAAASVGPEAGTTYTVRFYRNGVIESTQAGITGTTSAPFALSAAGTAKVTVEAVRDGVGCWQLQERTFDWVPGLPGALLHFDGANDSTVFADAYGKVWTPSGNAKISTAQSRFGGSSALFDGTADFISTPHHADFVFGSGDFTVALQLRLSVVNQVNLASKRTGTAFAPFSLITTAAGKVEMRCSINGTTWGVDIVGATTLAPNTWYHIAFVRSGNTFYLFVNGALDGTATLAGTLMANTDSVYVGANSDGSASINGHLDELLVQKGALYTAPFTPPTGPYSDP